MIKILLKIVATIAALIAVTTARAATTNITIVNDAFVPSVVTINVGDTVNWPNADGQHTVSGRGTDQSQFCGSGVVESCSETFNTAGSFPYLCNIHFVCCNMTGMVVVVSPQPPAITTQPVEDMTLLEGSTVSFAVAATGSSPLSYQWQLNSANLTDGGNITGSQTTNLVITDVSTNQAGTYTVIVSNSLGSQVSSNAVLTVQTRNDAGIVVQPAALTRVNAGSNVTLTATGAGTPPLSYQWYLDGSAIDGATNTSYEFDALPIGAATSFVYTVSVSNNFSVGLSSNAEVVVIRAKTGPALTISTPAAGARTTNGLVSGKATSKAAITSVTYWITNINNGALTFTPPAPATLGTGGTWSATPALLGGTNIISAMAVDATGNESPVVTRSFFYKVPFPVTLTIGQEGGNGSIVGTAFVPGDTKPGTNNPLLNVGEGYLVTAVPNSRSLFSNWSGTINSTNPALRFVMEPGMTLQANFITNFFFAAAGVYNGLFSVSGDITEQTAGEISGLTLKTSGLASGKLWLGGGSWGFSSAFNAAGNATATIPRAAKQGGPIQLQLTLDTGSAPAQLTGTVSGTNGGEWTSELLAEPAATAKGTTLYTMLMTPPANLPANAPPGTGYAAISQVSGNVTLAGALADGSVYSQFTMVSASGDVPVYASLYTNTGLLLGWINLPNLAVIPSTTSLTWIKPGGAGFTNDVTVVGSPWTNPPAHTAAITLAANELVVSNATLSLDFNVTVSNNNAVVKIPGGPTNILTGSINPKTGVLKVGFGNGNGKSTNAAAGAILQDQNIGAGYFTTKSNAGSLNLQ